MLLLLYNVVQFAATEQFGNHAAEFSWIGL
jgi:hypothetical protein